MTKFEEELMATAKMIPTSDGNEIKFKTSSALYDYLLVSNGEAELYLQQQALPVVPEFVAEFIESYKDRRTIYGVFDKISKNRKTYPKLYEWVFEDENSQATFALAFITGKYEVEKPKLFYLENKITGMYLSSDGKEFYEHHKIHGFKFTQSEIDSMETGSYEQIEVVE
ncbi:DUF1642 domain-containing protein [Lactococcus lactis]|uniref:DUF1642 domain-containing protein n=1 Tax=Lactococcus lactis TaxID=1358 RepID=UPI00288F151D|nr:DUF1642 domain-containing protein [Lactococcus lactis]MDT2860417.1 DUF1642 domain-containing protein [Lactococcus lactis]